MEVDEEVQEKMSPGCSKVLKVRNYGKEATHGSIQNNVDKPYR